MRPSRLLLIFASGICLSAFALALSRQWIDTELTNSLSTIWQLTSGLLLLVSIADLLLARQLMLSECYRTLPGSLSLGASNLVTLTLVNPYHRSLHLLVTDTTPAQIKVSGLPINVFIPSKSSIKIKYSVVPIVRGNASFGKIDLLIRSHYGLWKQRLQAGKSDTVKIYPNFAAIEYFSTLGREQQTNQFGIHQIQRRGEGIDFHQLREFREGDSMRQIDAKASARLNKLISKEYQDERDQEILFVLDCGRRMRAKDGELSHFDHCLNAMLLASYVALRQGDAVGIHTFAGKDLWIPPIKGQTKINILLNCVYDLHSSTQTSDYLEAAESIVQRHNKRSLIIFISNIREEDLDDILLASQLLSKKHLVMFASLREEFIDRTLSEKPVNFKTAITYSGTHNFALQRKKTLDRLRAQNVIVTDSTPQRLHIDLVNEYLALKRSGRM